MSTLADRITAELRVLINEPLSVCWRAADMQVFEFGPMQKFVNRMGDEVEVFAGNPSATGLADVGARLRALRPGGR